MLLGAVAAAFGGLTSGGYNATPAVFTGSTTAQVAVTDASGGLAGFVGGQAVAWAKSGSGYEVGWLKDVTTGADPDTGQLLQTATAAPQGTSLYGSHTCYVAKDQPYLDGTPTSFSLRYTAHDSDDRLTLLGAVPVGLEMSWPLGELPTMKITWAGATYAEEGANGAATAQLWQDAGSLDYPNPEPIKGALVIWGTDAGADARIMRDITFSLGLTRNPLMDYNALNNIADYYTADVEPTVSFSVLRDVGEEDASFTAGTTTPFVATFGTRPGKMFSLCVPAAAVETYPGFEDGDSALWAPIVLRACENNGDTGSLPASAICRFAWI